MGRFQGLVGIAVILGIAFLLSSDRRRARRRMIAWGLGLQIIFALFMLKTRIGQAIFENVRLVADRCLAFTWAGAHFVFGALCPEPGVDPSATAIGPNLAFQCLTTIIFFASLMAVLYHLGIMQLVVRAFAFAMRRTMRTSGPETLCAAGNIFVGQTEAPLLIRPYVDGMTVSELATVMTSGFATIAGSVFVLYVSFGMDAGHLLTASVMSAPAALMIAKIVFPETDASRTAGGAPIVMERETRNIVDAAASGAAMGMKLALNVAAMLLAFIALLALANALLAACGGGIESILGDVFPGDEPLSLSMLFGWIFSPFAWCLGVPWKDATFVGDLLGTKIALNELIAYRKLGAAVAAGAVTPKSTIVATYALCGFANFGSIAIQIGGIGGIAPGRRGDLAAIGLRAMLAGALASFLTATIAGILY
ncbi:MAG: NupC/NupG family nucleoside CNT transporter [Planctomycetes bacterium]|nr:NupC/NupG family nucleoside CNT transporter [Planctomycetota bacterium]